MQAEHESNLTAMQLRPMEEWEEKSSNEFASDEDTYTDMRLEL